MVCKQSLCCEALPTPHCIQRELKSCLGRPMAHDLTGMTNGQQSLWSAGLRRLFALNQVITFFTRAGDMGKWRKRLPLS